MNPIGNIIEKLKNEHDENVTWYNLKCWYTRDFNNPNLRQLAYYKIYGFLYGLYASGYISESECDTAINYIFEELTKNA